MIVKIIRKNKENISFFNKNYLYIKNKELKNNCKNKNKKKDKENKID